MCIRDRGKIACIKYAREKKIPFLGICFGMQMAIIEFARNVLKIKKASSSELNSKCVPVVGLINEWKKDGKTIKGTDRELGGTMRLGSYPAELLNNSLILSDACFFDEVFKISLELLIFFKIFDQTETTSELILAKLLNEPKVK